MAVFFDIIVMQSITGCKYEPPKATFSKIVLVHIVILLVLFSRLGYCRSFLMLNLIALLNFIPFTQNIV